MEYSSILFIYIFFPVSLTLYLLTPQKLKDIVLLLLSIVFCGAFGLRYIALIAVYSIVNYSCGRLTGHLRHKKKKLRIIPFGVGAGFDLLVIFLFRFSYFSRAAEMLRFPKGFFPVGISFFTLSALGYLVDVYRGKHKAEKNFVRFSLYIMMFPRLFMGPVVRYDIFTRILRSRKVGLSEIGKGLSVFIKGLAKKVLGADTLYAMYCAVNSSDLSELSVGTAWLGITAYMLCLYFTLSGFADMGVGIGYCFGFRFPQSFNYPMFNTKIRYFAAKWHIQVIHWFRKYITRPLTARTGNRYLRKLIFVSAWMLAGFWYTFNIGGAVWGGLMGTAIVFENRLRNSKMLKSTGIIYTFLLTTVFAVFLSGDSLSYSLRYLFAMTGGNHVLADGFTLYLLKSYLVVLLVSMYASTDLFRNMLMRSGKNRIRLIAAALTPVMLLLILALCTALMTYNGVSGMILVRL